ncbi:MAG: hypothetical protein H6817_02280 [Phycisphaerales bacterium]|nr:hypothetical protein [Phycisphaerales bacterium]
MVCSDCGWEYTYGLTDASTRANGIYDENAVAICPNCRFANLITEFNDKLGNYESGDRILVLKWTYDIGGPTLGPKRWDVVVFKDPSDGVTNYIKRLAGLPNEVIQIVDGDLYSVKASELSEEARATLEADRHIKYLRRMYGERERGATSRYQDGDLSPENEGKLQRRELDMLDAQLEPQRVKLLAELDGKLHIQHKSEDAQRDLWRIVYDHDYPPREHHRGQPQWLADDGSNWSVGERTLHFDGVGAPEQSVSLSATIDSLCSYNTLDRGSQMRPHSDLMPVADLRMSFVGEYRKGAGMVAVRLIKLHDHFSAELHADGTVRLMHADADSLHNWTEFATAKVAPLTPGKPFEFAMENLDYRVRVLVNGREVLATTDEQYTPNIAALRKPRVHPPTLPPAIAANDLDVELRHVRVEHDIYYISEDRPQAVPLGYHAWAVENHPMWLRDGEFFMLGDNSAQSKDSRLWNYVGDHLYSRGEAYQLGTVPRDQLIGRAFFVYWPSGLRTSLIPTIRNIGWIPNFGRMRWIR